MTATFVQKYEQRESHSILRPRYLLLSA